MADRTKDNRLLRQPATFGRATDDGSATVRSPFPDGRVYAEDGIIVLTGPMFEEGCFGVGFVEPVVSVIRRPDGTEISHFSVVDQILVFEGDDPFVLIDAACGALVDDHPSTHPPDPIAVREGRVQHHQRVSPDGVRDAHNSVTGSVATSSGGVVHVNAFAKFTDSADGTVLHQLRVNYGG